jgi:hypothetical protein
MTYSIGAFFDPQTETEIRHVWQVMAESDIADYLYKSANRPHITLTIFEDLDLNRTSAMLCKLAGQFTRIPLSFQSISIFPDTNAVFLAPLVTPQLVRFQESVHRALISYASLPDYPFYLPGQWIPHCSIANYMPPENLLPAVQKAIETISLPITGWITEVGLTSFSPVVHLMNCKLAVLKNGPKVV